MSKRERVRNFLRFRFLRDGGKSTRAGTTKPDSVTSVGFPPVDSDVKLPPTQHVQHTTDTHEIPASDATSAGEGRAQSLLGDDYLCSSRPKNLPSDASTANDGSVSLEDEAPAVNGTEGNGNQQHPASSEANNAAVQPPRSLEPRPIAAVQSNHTDERSHEDPGGDRSFPPRLTFRTGTFGSTHSLHLPEHGQAAGHLQRIPSVRASLGLEPGPSRPSLLRYQGLTNIAQPSLDETPKLEQLFPMTIPAKCHICFNTNHQMQRLLTDAVLETVPAADEDEWSFETEVIELPDQEIEWYKHEAYDSLRPKGHMKKILDRHSDVRMKSLYTRHGCLTVVGPPELRQNLQYARFADVTELAQKSIHAICGFIHKHQYERFHLDIFWEYSFLQLCVPHESRGNAFHEIIKKGLKSKLVTNFRGQQYIPRCDLVMFQQPSVIKDIISQDESIGDEHRDGILELTLSRAPHLLLMCVYNKQPMKMFKHLLEIHRIDDDRLEAFVGEGYPPPSSEVCQDQDCLDALADIYRCAPEFLPLKVGKDPRYKVWKKDMVIPLHFYDNEKALVTPDTAKDDDQTTEAREIGRGANGHVLKVWAEPSLHSLPGSIKQTFALKKASNINPKAFEAERIMLEKLYDYPHGHITPHFGSWQQDDHNYILLPRAERNLRDYLTSVPPPRLRINAVKWFFDQLYGLADAIKHVHHIKPAGTLMIPEPADINRGYHHDIKPENILVFEKIAGAHPVLQIADFGAGSLYDADAYKVSRPPETMRGTRTYFSPDGNSPTRSVDLWSLGCCFLELTLWLFGLLDLADGREPFTVERKFFPGHNPDDTDDGFWYRRKDGKIDIKEPVINRINELRERYCKDMEVFQILLDAIRRPDGQKSLLTIDKHMRMDAPTLVDCLDTIRKHVDLQMRKATAKGDDDLYARYFSRNVNSPEQELTPFTSIKIRTTLTTDAPSSPRDSFEEEKPPTTPTPLQPGSGRRHRSTSSLVLQAGQGTEPPAEGDSHATNGMSSRTSPQTPYSPKDLLEQDLERLGLEK